MALGIKFNSTTLTGARSWSQKLASRVFEITIPRMDGVSVDTAPKRDARIITIDGRIASSSATALRTSINTIEAAIESGQGSLYLHDDRYLTAVKRQFDVDYMQHGKAADYQLIFVCPDPYFYSTSATSDTTNAISTPSTDVAINLGSLGNAPTPPVFTFTPSGGAATSVKFYNTHASIDTWIQFDGTIADGTDLIIDCGNLTATNAGTNCLSEITGDFYNLYAGASNTITVTTDRAGNMEYTFRARWY